MKNEKDFKVELLKLFKEVSESGLEGALPLLITECVKKAELKHNTNESMMFWTLWHIHKALFKESYEVKQIQRNGYKIWWSKNCEKFLVGKNGRILEEFRDQSKAIQWALNN